MISRRFGIPPTTPTGATPGCVPPRCWKSWAGQFAVAGPVLFAAYLAGLALVSNTRN